MRLGTSLARCQVGFPKRALKHWQLLSGVPLSLESPDGDRTPEFSSSDRRELRAGVGKERSGRVDRQTGEVGL